MALTFWARLCIWRHCNMAITLPYSQQVSKWVSALCLSHVSKSWVASVLLCFCLFVGIGVGSWGGEMAVEEVSVVHACTMCQLVTSMEGQNCAASTLGHRRSGESRMIKNARYWTQAQYEYGIFELGILARRLVRRNEGTLSQSYPELHPRFFRCNRGVIPSRMHWPQSLEFAEDRRDNEAKKLHSWMEIRFTHTRTKQQNHRQAIKVNAWKWSCMRSCTHTSIADSLIAALFSAFERAYLSRDPVLQRWEEEWSGREFLAENNLL